MNELKKVMMAYGNLVFPIEGTDKKYVTPLVDRQSYFYKAGISRPFFLIKFSYF